MTDIACFFGITVDDLLQAEKTDEKRLYCECKKMAMDLFRIGRAEETIPLWQEALRKMPNNADVKEMCMSACFDTDKRKYQKEIIELSTELHVYDTKIQKTANGMCASV